MSLRRLALAGLACVASALPAWAAPAPQPAGGPPESDQKRIVVSGDKLTRTLDCAGADVAVMANDSTVTLKGCNSIRIQGDRDQVRADLLRDSDILVLGEHDVVRWTAFPGASNYVRDQGRHNTIAPF